MVPAMTPDLIQVVDVLTQEQVDAVIASITNEDYEPATVFGTEGTTIVDKKVRSNKRFCVPETHTASKIMHEAVNAALLTYRDNLLRFMKSWNTYLSQVVGITHVGGRHSRYLSMKLRKSISGMLILALQK